MLPSVSVAVRRPHILNIFSQTTGSIKTKFHMEPPLKGETKVYSNSPGLMINMAATPIYGKNLLKNFSSLEPIGK